MFTRYFASLMLCLSILGATEFDSTIPVIDMNDFFNPETKQKFVDEVSSALHEVGFFAVINTNVDQESLDEAYSASMDFFSSPIEMKNEIHDPNSNGQRGYVHSETAQGFSKKDFKEHIHIANTNNLWPQWMDLKTPSETLRNQLDEQAQVLQKAFALAIGEDENYLIDMTRNGTSLLRLLHYPANPTDGRLWAAQHTDIDLFTILPVSTEEGLQIYNNGRWIDVKVPAHSFIVNGGDMLQNLTNGYFKSSLHQVVAKPDVERYAIVYFIHPKNDDPMGPTEKSITLTDGIKRYPTATRLELLSSRLRELKLAKPELLQFEKDSHVMDRIEALVAEGVAADPVIKTYEIWKKT